MGEGEVGVPKCHRNVDFCILLLLHSAWEREYMGGGGRQGQSDEEGWVKVRKIRKESG